MIKRYSGCYEIWYDSIWFYIIIIYVTFFHFRIYVVIIFKHQTKVDTFFMCQFWYPFLHFVHNLQKVFSVICLIYQKIFFLPFTSKRKNKIRRFKNTISREISHEKKDKGMCNSIIRIIHFLLSTSTKNLINLRCVCLSTWFIIHYF